MIQIVASGPEYEPVTINCQAFLHASVQIVAGGPEYEPVTINRQAFLHASVVAGLLHAIGISQCVFI